MEVHSVFFGVKRSVMYFLGLKKNTRIVLGLVSERTFRFGFSLSANVEQKGR